MKKYFFILFLPIFIFSDISALYKTLEPNSISKHLIFYKLYPETSEGKKALQHVFSLLRQNNKNNFFNIPKIDLSNLLSLFISKEPLTKKIKEKDLSVIEEISKNLKNRKLKTYGLLEEKNFISANPEEIDLARAIFLAKKMSIKEIRCYEAYLDIMALEILTNLPKQPSYLDKIKAINDFIFFDLGFSFPEHSQSTKKIDSYTNLPSVMDKRKGVCLGLSILYLCLAQRIDLPLDAVTIPGHIFLKYKDRNIETTRRGVHIPDEKYLNMETKSIKVRDKKEVIGLLFINEASIFLKEKDYTQATILYEKAQQYLPNSFILKQLLGFCYIFSKKEKEGKKLLLEIREKIFPSYTMKEILASDFLDKKVDKKGIEEVFLPFENTKKSLLQKKDTLLKILKKYPKFRFGLLLLSNIWLELGRDKEALNVLLKYYKIDQKNPLITFYISIISFQRSDFKNSWKYLNITKNILQVIPKMVEDFQEVLTISCLN
ncbi:MAG: hypothetical protein AMS24_01060 [Chlamydiae bacterium SM23_39]|nr:MAG: hypothetical protein AMS24_01060 [Chlamydiae bacterium SM23_39]